MLLPMISFLTEVWHFLDVNAVAGHGAVLSALLLKAECSNRSVGRYQKLKL